MEEALPAGSSLGSAGAALDPQLPGFASRSGCSGRRLQRDGVGWGGRGALVIGSGLGAAAPRVPAPGNYPGSGSGMVPGATQGEAASLDSLELRKSSISGVVSPPSQRCFPARMVPFLKQKLEISPIRVSPSWNKLC